jgi:hypothetical protein
MLPEAPHKLTTTLPSCGTLKSLLERERERERARKQMTVVSCSLLTGLPSTGLSGGHGIDDVHNNKTTSNIIGHFHTFLTVFSFSIPKQKMLAKFTLP